MVLHPDYYLLVHGEPGGLLDSGADGHPDRVCGRPRRPERDQIRHSAWRLNNDVFQVTIEPRLFDIFGGIEITQDVGSDLKRITVPILV